jgi:hypothetical protein
MEDDLRLRPQRQLLGHRRQRRIGGREQQQVEPGARQLAERQPGRGGQPAVERPRRVAARDHGQLGAAGDQPERQAGADLARSSQRKPQSAQAFPAKALMPGLLVAFGTHRHARIKILATLGKSEDRQGAPECLEY